MTTARPPASWTACVYERRSASRGGARSRPLRPGVAAQAGSASARSSCVTTPMRGGAGRGGGRARRVAIGSAAAPAQQARAPAAGLGANLLAAPGGQRHPGRDVAFDVGEGVIGGG